MSTDNSTIDWYNNNADGYAAHVRNSQDSIYHAYYEKPAMYSLLPEITGKKVLSLGCGSGEDTHYLKNQGAERSYGIDVSHQMIHIAKDSYVDCDFRVMDMEKLDFQDREFDFVYSSLAIHYIKDWTKVFCEVYRVLKSDSYFLFSCAHPISSAMVVTEEANDHKIKQLATIRNKAIDDIEIVGDYLNRRQRQDGLGGLGEVITWHKSISEIISEANTAGFLVEKFAEPRPMQQMAKISKRDYKRLNKIPEFMIFRLLKT